MTSQLTPLSLFKVLRSSGYIKEISTNSLTHPKIKGLDGGLEPPTSGLPVHCSTT